jgi:hypothetical protein
MANFAAAPLIDHVRQAVANAFANVSKLPVEITDGLEGMSGAKTRHLYNNVCSLQGATYLEVGTFKGSSFIAAMYGNPTLRGICIDHWSEFGGREDFYRNLKSHLPGASNVTVIDDNCWDVRLSQKVDIFMYDGAHSYEDHKRAITHFAPCFSNRVVLMIDDWCCDWVSVRRGTLDGIRAAGLKVLWSQEIGLVNADRFHQGGDTFWNGCGIFVCAK